MSRKSFAAVASFALIVLFVIIVAASAPFARRMRIDLTESHLYSLSDGAKRTLRAVVEPTALTFYYSRQSGSKAPELRAQAARVREMLASFEAASSGKISIREVDPQPFSPEEDAAINAGLAPASTPTGDQVYLGVTGKSALGQIISAPFLDPKRTAFLEYDLTRLVAAIDSPKRPKVALITSLPLRFGPGGPAAYAQGASKPFNVYDEMARIFDVEVSPPDFTELPTDADVLFIAHPWPLSPAQIFAIDQFILAKGRALIMTDPSAWIASPASGAAQYAAPQSSDLNRLFASWGISLGPQIVADKSRALPIEVTDSSGRNNVSPQPLFLRLSGTDLAKNDPVTASLPRGVHLATPGPISLQAGSPFKLTPLLESSADAMIMDAGAAMLSPSPAAVMGRYQPGGRKYVLGARLRGSPASAFPQGPPSAAQNAAKPLTQAVRPVELIVIGDADMLEDGFYVNPQDANTVADNAALIVNAIESLSGSDSLLSLRARVAAPHPMTRLDSMRKATAAKLAVEETRLAQELEATEARLRGLRAQAATSSARGARATSMSEIERFQARAFEIRARLRDIHHTYSAGLERLRTILLALNTIAAPLLLALGGAFIALRRRRAASKAST